MYRCIFYFFQAEDGIRDGHLTGVQTCALPISAATSASGCTAWITGLTWPLASRGHTSLRSSPAICALAATLWGRSMLPRSEERRVGNDGRSRGRAGAYIDERVALQLWYRT